MPQAQQGLQMKSHLLPQVIKKDTSLIDRSFEILSLLCVTKKIICIQTTGHTWIELTPLFTYLSISSESPCLFLSPSALLLFLFPASRVSCLRLLQFVPPRNALSLQPSWVFQKSIPMSASFFPHFGSLSALQITPLLSLWLSLPPHSLAGHVATLPSSPFFLRSLPLALPAPW